MGEYTTINPNSKEKRREHDLYPTPEGLVRAIFNAKLWWYGFEPENILDPGCGEGIWGKVAREVFPKANIVGVEIRKEIKDIENSKYYNEIYLDENYLAENSLYPRDWQLRKYDLIIGNPPYGPRGMAEEFIRTSFKYLSNNGQLIFLLRQAFLASRHRYNGLWKEHLPFEVLTLSRRPSFSGNKKTDGEEYAVFSWFKHTEREYENQFIGRLLDWDY